MAKILLIEYDNGSHIPVFPQNLFALVGALEQKKIHQVGVWNQAIHHGRSEALTEILDRNPFDIVGLGFVAGYYQYKKAKEISHAVNQSVRRKSINYVLGGHGPAADPEYFMRVLEADTVVVGDGERAICNIAETNKKGVIQGLPCESDDSPIGAYRHFDMNIYRLVRFPTSNRTDFCAQILSSRGCKWKCSFCYRMREGFHERAIGPIMEEIRYLHDNVGVTHFQFSDELLMSSEERTGEVCEAILGLGYPIKWDCNGRLNFAKKPLVDLMKKSGCEYVNYGIESLNQGLLNSMRKGLTVDQIVSGVEASLEAGLSPGLNLIWGFPGDTPYNLTKAVDFIKKYDPCDELRTIRPVTPYPGTELFKLAVEQGLIESTEDFYERKHVNSDLFSVNFMEIPTKYAHECLLHANQDLQANYLEKRGARQLDDARRMYLKGDASFRGWRDV
jgi:radical SAM superfamily enzyme YgiQ (UPF0313 family)